MELGIPCFLAVAEQEEGAKTFVEADCSLLVNEYDNDYYGIMIDCELDVIRDRVDACLATSKGIRLVVTIDGEDVSDALTETVTIRHALNEISSFSLTLADSQYSPLVNAHIETDVEIVVTAFVGGEEFKIFTGLVDTPKTRRTKNFRLKISGRGYGRKLLDKRATLISIQDSAENKYRGSLVKYVAGQAGIADVNCPRGDLIITDHSFQDQKTWDIVQKECEIEGWFVRFDEEAVMQIGPKIIKTDLDEYPEPDWEYDEGEFVELGFNKTSKGVINKVIVLGAIFEEEIVTIIPAEDEPSQEVDVPEEEYDEDTTTFSKSFTQGEVVTGWTDGDASLKVTASYTGFTKPSGYIFPTSQNYKFTITGSMSGKISSLEISVSGDATGDRSGSNHCSVQRGIVYSGGFPPTIQEAAFSITITIKTKELSGGGSVWITENLSAEEEADRIETTIEYTQVKATVQDAGSIAQYGERKPREEYALHRPLAETEAQCKRVGENKIIDSHKYTKQPDILVNYNPLLTIGQTVELYDTKIGYNGERWLVGEIVHTFPINSKTGAIKPRTRAGCLFYA